MTDRQKKVLIRKLEKLYWKNNQRLYISTMEEFSPTVGQNNYLSVCVTDGEKGDIFKGVFLFEIRNYSSFYSWNAPYRNCFTDPSPCMPAVIPFDVVSAACTPRYKNGEITLYKFEDITPEDIMRATRYFLDTVLDGPLLFNFKYRN